MSQALPIIESCNGCGACCLSVRSPPFVVYLDLADGSYRTWDAASETELERLTTAPAEAVAAFLDGNQDERPTESPCSWLELSTRRCRYYDHRPQICRDFQLGGDDCRQWRRQENIGLSTASGKINSRT